MTNMYLEGDAVSTAMEKLGEFGVSVDYPRNVVQHEKVSSTDEMPSDITGREGVGAASYKKLLDRIDIYEPSAKAYAVNEELSGDGIQEIISYVKGNSKLPKEAKKAVKGIREEEERSKISNGFYGKDSKSKQMNKYAHLFDLAMAVNQGSKQAERLQKTYRNRIIWDTEHELLHKWDVDQYCKCEGGVERANELIEPFERYVKEVQYGLQEWKDTWREPTVKRRVGEGPRFIEDFLYAAAIEKSDRYEAIREAAIKEFDKWKGKIEEVNKNYDERKKEVKDEIDSLLSDNSQAMLAYKELENHVMNSGIIGVSEEEIGKKENNFEKLVGEGTAERVYNLFGRLKDIEKERNEELNPYYKKQEKTGRFFKEAINRELEINKEEVEEYIEPAVKMIRKMNDVPTNTLGEARNQIWTAFRMGELSSEAGKEKMRERSQSYKNGEMIDYIDHLLTVFDEANGSEHERMEAVLRETESLYEQHAEAQKISTGQ